MYLRLAILKQQILYYKQITFVFKHIHICFYKSIRMAHRFCSNFQSQTFILNIYIMAMYH